MGVDADFTEIGAVVEVQCLVCDVTNVLEEDTAFLLLVYSSVK